MITVGRGLIWVCGLLAVIPLAVSITTDLATRGLGLVPGLGEAYLNSCLLAAAASLAATLAAAYLLFVVRRGTEAAVFAAMLFVAPGDFVAIGMTRFVRAVIGMPNETLRGIVLILVEAGYCYPFILVALVGCFVTVGNTRIYTLHELTPNSLTLLGWLFRSYRSAFLLAWLLGFNLVLSETSRTTILAGDVFGLGRKFFAPEVATGFATKGVDPMLIFVTVIPVLPLGLVAYGVRRRLRERIP